MYLGTVIRRQREIRGWSQEALAANIPGLSQSELSRIENNKKHPDWGQITAFAAAFDMSVEELVREASESEYQITPEAAELHKLQKKVFAFLQEQFSFWIKK